MIKDKALEFATKAHEGQYRSDGVTPYIEHPKAVGAILEALGANQDIVLAVAYLHDVVEDTDVTLDDIRANFGDAVANNVEQLTKTKEDPYPFAKIRSEIASLVKLADRLHNLKSMKSGGWGWERRFNYAAIGMVLANNLIKNLVTPVGIDAGYKIHAQISEITAEYRSKKTNKQTHG